MISDEQIRMMFSNDAKKRKKRLSTSKKAFWVFIIWCSIIQTITLYFAIKLSSEMLLGIFAGSAVVEPIAIYKFYLEYNKEINLKHMDQNYMRNYDEVNGIK